MIFDYILKNIDEIKNDKNLTWYGFILCLTHLLSAYFFYPGLPKSDDIICWQFFENCHSVSTFILNSLDYSLLLYGFFSVICAVYFLLKKNQTAYILFFGLSAFKFIVHLSDYRFMGNYHYMSHVINFVFLLILNKKNMIKLMIVLFYMSAAMIKFNPDWLSGSALLRPTFLKQPFLGLACAYVIFLELVISILLLSKQRKLFYFALFQISCFHIFSWHIVGYFYPLIMFGLLALFFMNPASFEFPKNKTNLTVLAIFILAQILPIYITGKNSSLSNEYRVYSLNMLDAYTVCETRMFIKNKNSVIEYAPDFTKLAIRVHCDPVFVQQKVQKTCEFYKNNTEFLDIDFDHQVRRKSDPTETYQATFKNVCARPLKIHRLSGGFYQKP